MADTGACACGRPAGETEHLWALHGCATWDDRVRGWKFWEQDGYAMWLIPMLVNHRIVVGGVDADGYTAGWCYSTALSGHGGRRLRPGHDVRAAGVREAGYEGRLGASQ